MSAGWIKLHRVLLENPLLTRPRYLAVFVYILLSVNHKDAKIILNDQPLAIRAGGGIFSQIKMAERLGLSRRTLARALKYLKSAQVIELRATNKFTLIRAVNWQAYQDSETETAHQTRNERAPNAHPARTNKKEKNDKNEKNPHEDKKIFQELVRWVANMDGKIVHPKKYVAKLFEKYPERLITRCVHQSNCTSLTMFARNMRELEKRAAREQNS